MALADALQNAFTIAQNRVDPEGQRIPIIRITRESDPTKKCISFISRPEARNRMLREAENDSLLAVFDALSQPEEPNQLSSADRLRRQIDHFIELHSGSIFALWPYHPIPVPVPDEFFTTREEMEHRFLNALTGIPSRAAPQVAAEPQSYVDLIALFRLAKDTYRRTMTPPEERRWREATRNRHQASLSESALTTEKTLSTLMETFRKKFRYLTLFLDHLIKLSSSLSPDPLRDQPSPSLLEELLGEEEENRVRRSPSSRPSPLGISPLQPSVEPELLSDEESPSAVAGPSSAPAISRSPQPPNLGVSVEGPSLFLLNQRYHLCLLSRSLELMNLLRTCCGAQLSAAISSMALAEEQLLKTLPGNKGKLDLHGLHRLVKALPQSLRESWIRHMESHPSGLVIRYPAGSEQILQSRSTKLPLLLSALFSMVHGTPCPKTNEFCQLVTTELTTSIHLQSSLAVQSQKAFELLTESPLPDEALQRTVNKEIGAVTKKLNDFSQRLQRLPKELNDDHRRIEALFHVDRLREILMLMGQLPVQRYLHLYHHTIISSIQQICESLGNRPFGSSSHYLSDLLLAVLELDELSTEDRERLSLIDLVKHLDYPCSAKGTRPLGSYRLIESYEFSQTSEGFTPAGYQEKTVAQHYGALMKDVVKGTELIEQFLRGVEKLLTAISEE
jgi:hypothetical protein